MKKAPFTLLEILIVLAILSIVAPIVGFRVHEALEKRRFEVASQRLWLELDSFRHRALNMQADWNVSLDKTESIVLNALCLEADRSRSSHWEAPFDLYWNGVKTDSVSFHFTSSGRISPPGELTLDGGKRGSLKLKIPEIFSLSEGKGSRPDKKNSG